MRKGQSYSLDLIIAVVIFLLVIAVFYTLVNKEQDAPARALQRSGQQIAMKLDAGEQTRAFALVHEGKINQSELQRLYGMPYEDLRKELGVTANFCIYLEDASGRVIMVGNKTGAGNPELMVAGTPCGENVSITP